MRNSWRIRRRSRDRAARSTRPVREIRSAFDGTGAPANGDHVLRSVRPVAPLGTVFLALLLAVVLVAGGGETSAQAPPDPSTTVPSTPGVDPTGDEAPVISGPTGVSFEENATADVAVFTATGPGGDEVTLSLGGVDSDAFTLTGGTLGFGSPPDFESPGDGDADNVYEVTLSASDGGSSRSLSITVTVTNVDEPGAVALSSEQPQPGTALTATLSDPDGSVSGVGWQWGHAGGDAIDGATSSSYTPVAADSGKSLAVSVTYTDGHGSGKSASAQTANPVQAPAGAADPPANRSPVFPSAAAERSVAENAPAGAAVGEPVAATDEDDDPLTYTLGDTDTASFTIDSETGQLRTHAALDHETRSTFSVSVTATDPDGATGSTSVTITVTDVDEPPVLAGPTQVSRQEGEDRSVATYTADDPEGVTIAWSLSGTDAADFGISDGAVSFVSSPALDSPADQDGNNVYELTVEATAGDHTVTLAVAVAVTEVNLGPVIAGSAFTLDFAENGTGAAGTWQITDPEGDEFTVTLAGTDADSFTVEHTPATSDYVIGFAEAPDFENPADTDGDNVYEFTLEMDDGNSPTTQAFEVTVTDESEPPSVEGPGTVDFAENGTGDVAAYEVTDDEGESFTVSLSGADADSFTLADGVLKFREAPDYESPSDTDTDNDYQVTVEATDANDNRRTVEVTVTVTDVDEPPTISGGPHDPTYPENGTDAVATYTATDPEGATITWSLGGTDSAGFTLSQDGVLEFASSPALDAPSDQDGNNVYELTVEATAGDHTVALAVAVTVTEGDLGVGDESEAPSVEGPGTVDFAENGAGDVAAYEVTDDEGDSFTVSLSGADADSFTLADGVLKFREAPDYESPSDTDTDNDYQVTVEATDANDNRRTVEVTVTVTDVDEPPTISGGPHDPTYPENGTDAVATYTATDPEGATITWSLGGDDAAGFSISGAGVLGFASSPDFENPTDAGADNIYAVTVEAGDGTGTVEREVRVTVTNVDEPGELTLSSQFPQVDTELTATLSDPDGAVSGETWEWSHTGGSAISGATSSNYTPVVADAGKSLTVSVAYTDGQGTGKTASALINAAVEMPNQPPLFARSIAVRSVFEDTPPGEPIGPPLTAVDPDDDPLTYELSGADAASFDIDTATGQLLTNETLDHLENPLPWVTVIATDPAGASAAITVSITVIHVPETAAQTADPYLYTWVDGDRTRRTRLQPGLIVTPDGEITPAAGGGGGPVFRPDSGGALMTLPGGVLLVLDPAWSRAHVRAFLARNSISRNRVSELGWLPNGFFVDTAPGFPSLELANTLAGQDGVLISTPNWSTEIETG